MRMGVTYCISVLYPDYLPQSINVGGDIAGASMVIVVS